MNNCGRSLHREVCGNRSFMEHVKRLATGSDQKVASKAKSLLLQWEKDLPAEPEFDALKSTIRSMRDDGVRLDSSTSSARPPSVRYSIV